MDRNDLTGLRRLASDAAGGSARSTSAQAGGTGTASAVGAPGEYTLPPLPYPYDALEPYIDAETMKLHHDKHHAAYVAGLNAAEKALAQARTQNNFDDIAKLELLVAFHGSGHYNHTVFWNNMKPAKQAKTRPEGDLLRQVEHDFGSLDLLKAQFSAAATKVEGNGWGALVWHPGFARLQTVAFMNHQNASLSGSVPLLLCDVWEHAYYLKYQNRRPEYVTAWWNVVDWANIESRYAAAKGLRL